MSSTNTSEPKPSELIPSEQSALASAPPDVQLAVDLIELLETNRIDPALALAALAIVQRDYQRKLEQGQAL